MPNNHHRTLDAFLPTLDALAPGHQATLTHRHGQPHPRLTFTHPATGRRVVLSVAGTPSDSKRTRLNEIAKLKRLILRPSTPGTV